jgi:prophage regulatory protein
MTCARVNSSIESVHMKDYEKEDNELAKGVQGEGLRRSTQVPEESGSTAGSLPIGRLLRLPEVLRIIPVSRSTWYDGVRKGRYPRPVHLSARTVAWPDRQIRTLSQRLAGGQ